MGWIHRLTLIIRIGWFGWLGLAHEPSQAQSLGDDGNVKIWGRGLKLTWNDFMAVPPASHTDEETQALSTIRLLYRQTLGEAIPEFLIINQFVRHKSWARDTSSAQLLAHEQLHFDIGELYARKIRRSLATLRKRRIKNEEAYLLCIQNLTNERERVQSQYDFETHHGVHTMKQKEWSKTIYRALIALKDYAYSPPLLE